MSLLRLGTMLRTRRGNRGIRDVAKEIGISPATLTRVEGGRQPDLETFQKICVWLQIDPAGVLGIEVEGTGAESELSRSASVHLRADKELSPSTANDLANLILAAQRELSRVIKQRRHHVSPRL